MGLTPLLTTQDLSKLINLSENQIRHLANKELIPSVKIGKRYYFNAEEIENHIEKLKANKI